MSSPSASPFRPPGPGVWTLETAHFTRPFSRFMAELFPKPFAEGFAETLKRYGVLLAGASLEFVDGFGYMQMRPLGAPPGATGSPPKLLVQIMTRLHPEMRRRVRTSARVFEKKIWREDLNRWDRVDRPAALRENRALVSVEPAALSQEKLIAYLDRCRENLIRMVRQHHAYNGALMMPFGDCLSQFAEATSLTPEAVLGHMRGSSRVSAGDTSERAAIIAALRADAEAQKILHSEKPDLEILEALRRHPGAVGHATAAYIDIDGHRVVNGFDISDLLVMELPHLLTTALRAALAASEAPPQMPNIEALLSHVSESRRSALRELFSEAWSINRLRDERALYSDAWALGVMRRALLEAARRAIASGGVNCREEFLEASYAEMKAILRGSLGAPRAAELAARRTARAQKSLDDAPPFLGGTPGAPPPVDWLPRPAHRTAKAQGAMMKTMFGEPKKNVEPHVVRGQSASPGVYEGTARRILGPDDFCRIERGDVLITVATSSAFMSVLPLIGAVVTDRGGILCHAAIIAREYGIPGVVGTTDGTKRISDGVRVRVDGAKGEVRILEDKS